MKASLALQRENLRTRCRRGEVRNVGLFSGSFNPPHPGHIRVAERALDEDLDHIVLFPHSNNSAKRHLLAPIERRLELLLLLLQDSARCRQFTVWDPSFSDDFRVAEGFRRFVEFIELPTTALSVICGVDSIRPDMPDYLEPIRHIIHERPGFDRAGRRLPRNVRWMAAVSDLSSTAVRRAPEEAGDVLRTFVDSLYRQKLSPTS